MHNMSKTCNRSFVFGDNRRRGSNTSNNCETQKYLVSLQFTKYPLWSLKGKQSLQVRSIPKFVHWNTCQ